MSATPVSVKSYKKTNKIDNIEPSQKMKLFLAKARYTKPGQLCETLQGSLWLAHDTLTDQDVAIKIAIRDLVNTSSTRYSSYISQIKL